MINNVITFSCKTILILGLWKQKDGSTWMCINLDQMDITAEEDMLSMYYECRCGGQYSLSEEIVTRSCKEGESSLKVQCDSCSFFVLVQL
jgi:hypothetical protein